jgi:hypothetical protein
LAEDLLRATDSLSSHYDLNKALLEAMVSGRSIEGIGNDASFRAASGGGQDLR